MKDLQKRLQSLIFDHASRFYLVGYFKSGKSTDGESFAFCLSVDAGVHGGSQHHAGIQHPAASKKAYLKHRSPLFGLLSTFPFVKSINQFLFESSFMQRPYLPQ